MDALIISLNRRRPPRPSAMRHNQRRKIFCVPSSFFTSPDRRSFAGPHKLPTLDRQPTRVSCLSSALNTIASPGPKDKREQAPAVEEAKPARKQAQVSA